MSRTGGVLNTFVSVGLTDTAVLAANAGRRQFTIVNDGANKVYLALIGVGGGAAVAGSGILLASGASYTDNFWEGSVRAIALVGTTNITVCEY